VYVAWSMARACERRAGGRRPGTSSKHCGKVTQVILRVSVHCCTFFALQTFYIQPEFSYRERTTRSRSPKTPIAVTAAPAPAPWMTSGLGYRSVVNATTFALPSSAANGCDCG